MLCKFCAQIDLDKVRGYGYKHHKSYTNLHASAQAGCEFCTLIKDTHDTESGQLTPDWDHSLDGTQITIRLNPFIDSSKEPKINAKTYDAILVSQDERKNSETRLQAWFNLSTFTDDPLADLIPRRLISKSPAADECLNVASNWLQKCLEDHVHCSNNTRSPKLLPTRVIDVGMPNNNDQPVLLVSNGSLGEWVTLSYCWGSFDSVKTTMATLEAHQTSLPIKNLPLLFRDDSYSDWKAEAANMGYIYKNSALTITAESASDPTESILGISRETRYPVKLPCYSQRHQINGFIFPHLQNAEYESVLKTRAWTLQEDILSPRVLKFKNKQLEWNCRTTSCSEEYPKGDAKFVDRHGIDHFKRVCLSENSLMEKRYQNLDLDLDASSCNPMEIWRVILNNFVRRKLTHNNDRLPSISGVAKEVARHTGYNYKAGLWEQEILTELLWSTDGYATRLVDYIAPSWSWASLDFATRGSYLFRGDEKGNGTSILKLARVLSFEISYAGTDEFGQVVSGARLSIWGRCMEIGQWRKNEQGFTCWLDVDKFTSGLDHLPSNVLLMQIICAEQSFEPVSLDHGIRKGLFKALILEPVNSIKSEYRRIGVAKIDLERGKNWSARTVVIL